MPLSAHRRVVVTGAGSGLGRAFCVELAARGARIVASDINLASAQATVGLLGGVEVHAVRCDVGSAAEVQVLAEQAERLLGGVDLLINNAGVGGGGRIGEIPLEDWQWTLSVNLWGVIHGCHVFVPKMRRQGGGQVINVASAAGLVSLPQLGPYNVTKAAVVSLSETLHAELAGTGIGVTVVCPTFFESNIIASSRGGGAAYRELGQALMRQSRLTAADVARLALDGAAQGRLYVVTHADGRWMWRMKRLLPSLFQALVPRVARSRARSLGVELDP